MVRDVTNYYFQQKKLECVQNVHTTQHQNHVKKSVQYKSDDGGHDVIDNFKLPCNSMEI